ncbi:MAG: histidinol dehydrogenase [Chitinophagaceae bacterium]|nr:histidinol dehydrogenase [Chitinophagaceae bacterium]MCB9055893.1 histidinol dehydrogenase [Chitinophagales bacterium]
MEIFNYPEKDLWDEIILRPAINTAPVEKAVKKIMQKVKENGDRALRRFTKEYDGVKIKKIRVSEKELIGAERNIDPLLKTAIDNAKKNIESFHALQKKEEKKIETMPGVVCWRRSVPIEKVGLYIPGGTAPLFSTVLMLGIPAQLAGCPEIVLCTPPDKSGNIHPAVLYAARICGITNIMKVGGVQAIAAMTYGTQTVPKVFKIFGPGNRYVTYAKQMAQMQSVAIDMPAGPSELLVLADDTAVPEFVAADLLSQAEHGKDSQVVLVTTSESLARKVLAETGKQLNKLKRKKIAKEALENSKLIILKYKKETIEFTNLYAPEHLIIAVSKPEETVRRITAAGSVFIGNYSPESAGDYASGTNHTLPTNGFAAMYGGISVDSFVKKITYQQLTKEGLKLISNTVITMAKAEGLDAHRKAVTIRLKN